MEPRHAYLIAAHGNEEQLKALLSLLDDPHNDIYLHMDKKARSFRPEDFTAVLSRASIAFVPRLRSGWGSPRFIDVMVSLLAAAMQTPHQYYHLLSGVDLPLKSQDEIRAFFDAHDGMEFMNYQHPQIDPDALHYRLGIYHPLSRLDLSGPFAGKLSRLSEALQNRLGVDRLRHCAIRFQKGHLWFSVTHAFAVYAVREAPRYRKLFRQSVCGDELFFHTIMLNSPFEKNRYMPEAWDDTRAILRYIDWESGTIGSPYTFTLADYDRLIALPHLFARKFNLDRDPELFKLLTERIAKRQEAV